MEFYYSIEKNVQIIIALLKAHGIKKVVASPGTTNVCLVESMSNDGSFEMFSSADERSAAYIACGMAAESGEPVVLTCTGATASRNYIPALTEAYYRKLPVIALTATLHEGRIGQNYPQAIDRRTPLNDISVFNTQLPYVCNEEDAWANNLKVNNALIACKSNGGGPVQINWVTRALRDFSVKELPYQRKIDMYIEDFPPIKDDRVAIFIGAHQPMNKQLTDSIEKFCEKYNGVVLVDQTSNYKGKYKVFANLITYQELKKNSLTNISLLIYLGNVSGAYMSLKPEKVWRVNPDGDSRDCFKKVTGIFKTSELEFFKRYIENNSNNKRTEYYNEWKNTYKYLYNRIPELPFSNIWIASQLVNTLPNGSVLHLGILNSLRSWNFFESDDSVFCFSNTGGFGIDGVISSLIGASLVHKDKLYFGVVGDLAFFYDMNSIGNRHVGNNIRLMIVNNGRGTEFRNYNHNGAMFGAEETDKYVAAAGHYGNQSKNLVKHYAIDLGFEYITASNKEDFKNCVSIFLDPNNREKSVVFEVFTDSVDESDALKLINSIDYSVSGATKSAVKKVLGNQGIRKVKNMLRRG